MAKVFGLIIIAVLIVASLAPAGLSQTISAASCSANDVATALGNVAADGTQVVIPACPAGVGWGAQTAFTHGNASVDANGQINYNQTYSVVIQGQGTTTGSDNLGNPTGYNDQTVIIYDNAQTPQASSVLHVSMAPGKTLRITGITIRQGTAAQQSNGALAIGGKAQSKPCATADGSCLRFDHNHFYNINNVNVVTSGWIYGVADHNYFDFSAADTNGIRVLMDLYNNDAGGLGDQSWTDAENWGTKQFFFIENNTVNQSNTGTIATINDCVMGGREVIRYNTMKGGNVYVQTHPIGVPYRGCRATEIYMNNADETGTTLAPQPFHTSRSGASLVWGNTLTGYGQVMNVFYDRDGVSHKSLSLIPSGYGYCGNNVGGQVGTSPWDQNSNSSGYACIDQPGRGKGDLLSGLFPNRVNTALGNVAAWPRQALAPIYVWGQTFNTPNGGGVSYFGSETSAVMAENRDYYLELPNYGEQSSTFDGTKGIGQGPFSSRASTCSSPTYPGPAFWATDQNTLYVCTSANTWSAYYAPYTYPHPLISGSGGSGNNVAPPTALTATVQ